MTGNERTPIVNASDVAVYAFCARAFWLGRVKGVPSHNVDVMAAGEAAHAAHGRRVVGYQQLRRAGVMLVVLSVTLLVITLALLVRGA